MGISQLVSTLNLRNNLISDKKYLYLASLGICAALYFIWPTVHTIALRKLLLLSGATIAIFIWYRSAERKDILNASWLMYSVLLLGWVIFHAVFISQNGIEAWNELRGQWLPRYVAMLAGIGCALASRSISPRTFRLYLWGMLAAQPVFYLLVTLIKSVQIGHLAIGYWGMSDHKMSLTFYANLLAAASCAKMIDAVKLGAPSSSIYPWMLPIVLAFYVAILSNSLNGIILVGGSVLLTAMVLAYLVWKKIPKGVIAATAMLGVFALYALSTSSYLAAKWENLASDSRVAVNIDTTTEWRNFSKFGLPKNDQGVQVRESYYLRVAYATAGLRAIIENPWGYGVTRHAFEQLIQQKYPDAVIANSHNAYIDLVSAVGFPALLLLAMMVVSVFKQLKRARSEWAHPAMWMIGIVAMHWMIDPISRDHYFETLLFLIGLFSTLTLESKAEHARQT